MTSKQEAYDRIDRAWPLAVLAVDGEHADADTGADRDILVGYPRRWRAH